MHQNNENIKIIKLDNGDDIVCNLPKEQYEDKHLLLKIEKPLQVKYVPQLTPDGFRDYVALIKWAPYTSDTIVTIPKSKIMTVTSASEEMKASFTNISREYLLAEKVPARRNYESERLTDEQNKKVNEIFDQFDDDEPPTFH